MPLDVAAAVISNTHLSSDYNVLALAAPDIAERALPGQFVMVKAGDRLEPLLRRPFSVFEVLKENGSIVGLSLLNKRIGPSTTPALRRAAGRSRAVPRPARPPFAPVAPPDEAWLVAGGVGLAPFATLAETLRARHSRCRLYYGARRAAELFFLDMFERWASSSCSPRRMAAGVSQAPLRAGVGADRGRVTLPLERDLKARSGKTNVMIYACGPEPMLAAVRNVVRRRTAARRRSRSSASWAAASADATAA